MINLLPLEEKQKLSLKNKEKLAIVWGIVVLVFLICFILILLSIKFLLLAETDYQKGVLLQNSKKIQTTAFINSIGIIQKYNGTLASLNNFYSKEIYFNKVLETITNIPSPEGLFLTNFSLNRNTVGAVKVSVSGFSDTRDNLLLFRKSIESNKAIKNSYFSPSSWTSPKNVNFSVTFEIISAN